MNNPMMPGAVGYPAQPQTQGFAAPAVAQPGQGFQLPAHIAQRAAETGGPRKLATVYDGLKYITLRNGQFLLDMGGNNVQVLPNPLVAVVLAWQPEPGRVYYDQAYTPGAKNVTPACWSVNGREPSAKAPRRPSTRCDVCPMNAKGSGRDGRSKACSYSQRIVLAVPGYEQPLALKLGGMSLFGKNSDPSRNQFLLNEYGKQLAAMNADVSWVWTAFTFQPQASVPALFMGFHAGQNGQPWLSPEELAWASGMADAATDKITEVVAGEFFVAGGNENPEGEAQYPQAPIQQGHPAAQYAGGATGAPVVNLGGQHQPVQAPAATSMQDIVSHMQAEHAQQQPQQAPQQPYAPAPMEQTEQHQPPVQQTAYMPPQQPQVHVPQVQVPQPPQGYTPPQMTAPQGSPQPDSYMPPQQPQTAPQAPQAPAQQAQQAPQAPAAAGVPDLAAIMAAMTQTVQQPS